MPPPVLQPKPLNPPTLSDNESMFSGVTEVSAVDRATQEAIALNDMGQFIPSLQGNLQENTFLLDVTKSLYSELASEQLQSSFVTEIESAKDEQQIAEVVGRYERAISKQDADIRTLALVDFLKKVPSEYYNQDAYDKYEAEFLGIEDFKNLRNQTSQESLMEMKETIWQFAGSKAFDTLREGAVEIGEAVLVPGQEVALNAIAAEAGVPLSFEDITRSGFGRQETRDYLASLSEVERVEVVKRLIGLLDEWSSDPVRGVMVSDLAIYEYVTSVLGDETLAGVPVTDNVDVWLSNIVTALDLTWVGGAAARLLGRAGKSLQGLFSNRATRQILRTGDQISTPKARDVTETLRNNPDVRRTMDVADEEVSASRFPVPEELSDSVVPLPVPRVGDEGRTALIQAEVDRQIASIRRSWVTPQDKKLILAQEMEALANSSSGVIRVGSSSIKYLPEEEGFRTKVLIGATESSGWKGSKGFDDVVDTLNDMDPIRVGLEVIGRVPGSGRVRSLYTVPKQEGATSDVELLKKDILTRAGEMGPNTELYIRATTEKFWPAEDKLLFGTGNPVFRTGQIHPYLVPPNTMFTPEIYNSTVKAFSVEQNVASLFEQALAPTWKLSNADKRFVDSTFNWLNSFAETAGRNPTLSEYKAEFPDITPRQLRAIENLRQVNDTWYHLSNNRLYRHYKDAGFITAHNPLLSTFHGKPLDREVAVAGDVYDPVSRKVIPFTNENVDELYDSGGRLLKVDIPINSQENPRIKSTRVIIDPEAGYALEALHNVVLDYHPGYFLKFHEDPFLLVKRWKEITVDGNVKTIKESTKNSAEFTEALRTVGSINRGEKLAKRLTNRVGSDEFTFAVIPVRNLGVQERTAQIQSMLNRQGRLFYDARDYRMLKNLDGELATRVDLNRSLEMGIHAMARQLTMEDQVRVWKQKFREQYGELIDNPEMIFLDSGELSGRLSKRLQETTEATERRRLQEASTMWEHIRSLEGVNTAVAPHIKAWALNTFRFLSSPMTDKAIIEASPITATRHAVFTAFMATRPARQLLLQSMQAMFLSGLDPVYFGTGKFLSDMVASRIGVYKLKGLNTDWSNEVLAGMMGLKKHEYNLLIRKMNESGILQHAGVHSVDTGSRAMHRSKVPSGTTEEILKAPFRLGGRLLDFLKFVGFETGERNNLSMSYLVSLRRLMRNKKYKKVTELKTEDWDFILSDASNLAMGMIRVNEFPYQRNMFSLAGQFFSFTHRILVSTLMKNPALSKREVLTRILPANLVLWGGAFVGIKEMVSSFVTANEEEIPIKNPELRETLIDVISGGVIDTLVNKVGEEVFREEWESLDLETLAPGPGGLSIFYENLVDAGMAGSIWPALFGPSANLVSNTARGIQTGVTLIQGDPEMAPSEKWLLFGDLVLSGALPGFRDWSETLKAAAYGEWYMKGGATNSDARATWNTLVSRGLFAIRSDDQQAVWRLNRNAAEREREMIRDVTKIKEDVARILNAYEGGEMTYEKLHQMDIMFGNLVQARFSGPEEQIRALNMLNNADFGGYSVKEKLGEMISRGIFKEEDLSLISKLSGLTDEDREAAREYLRRRDLESADVKKWFDTRLDLDELESRQFLEDK